MKYFILLLVTLIPGLASAQYVGKHILLPTANGDVELAAIRTNISEGRVVVEKAGGLTSMKWDPSWEREADSVKIDRQKATREVKTGMLVKHEDGSVYQVDAVFKSGKVALTKMKPNDTYFSSGVGGYIRTDESALQDSKFISAVETKCTANKICVGQSVAFKPSVDGCKEEMKGLGKGLEIADADMPAGKPKNTMEMCQFVNYQPVVVAFTDDTVATSLFVNLVFSRQLEHADENRDAKDLIPRGGFPKDKAPATTN